jgi:hypothetical protein
LAAVRTFNYINKRILSQNRGGATFETKDCAAIFQQIGFIFARQQYTAATVIRIYGNPWLASAAALSGGWAQIALPAFFITCFKVLF